MRWLDRSLVIGPYVCLCTSEASFRRAVDHCKVALEAVNSWLEDGGDARTHRLKTPDGKLVCIVCIRPNAAEPIQIASLLVHEAVHVWQVWCASVGEREPSDEFEAYSVQAISQALMYAYAESIAA